jgi:type I restriction enzyme, S subunit
MKENWVIKKIIEIGKVQTGSTPKTSESDNFGNYIPFVKPSDFLKDGSVEYNNQGLSKIGLSQSRLVDENSVIMVCIGATIGKTGFTEKKITTNQQINSLTPLNGDSAKFIFYQMITQDFQQKVLNSSGQATLPIINKSKWSDLSLYLPPPPEQKRIVSILDEVFEGIDRAIANTEKNLTNARELFESYLNAVFTQKDDAWEEKKLGDICSIKHGFAFKGEFFTNEKSNYILLTPGSFHESGGYREQGEKTKYYVGEMPEGYILNSGDFLFAMTEQAVGLLGSSLIVPESHRFLHNQRLGLVQIVTGVAWHNEFFFHQFNAKNFRSAVQSSASGVKVRHTSPNKLGAISVFFPPTIAEQKFVADTLNELLAETQHLEAIYKQKLVALKELKQSILQKAFTGELTSDHHQTTEAAEENHRISKDCLPSAETVKQNVHHSGQLSPWS